jgi:hypothetical protein
MDGSVTSLRLLTTTRPLASVWRLVCLVLFSCILLDGNAKSIPPEQSQSATPIRIINTNAGQIMVAHANRHGDIVYIAGLVYRPHSSGLGAHIHLWGVDRNNHSVFSVVTPVVITGNPSFNRTQSYVLSVSVSAYLKAGGIYITFHGQSDNNS